MHSDTRLAEARAAYEQAVFSGDPTDLEHAMQGLDGVEADLTLARGRLLHARFLEQRVEDPRELALFEHAATLYRRVGHARGVGEALCWVGIVHQVVRADSTAAQPFLDESYTLAHQAGDALTASYAARHLGFALAAAGQTDAARAKLEESVQLRREIGFLPGVAAGLLALAEFAYRSGRPAEVGPLLDEAAALAQASHAQGIQRWIAAARTEFAAPDSS